MPTIKVMPNEVEFAYNEGSSLLELLIREHLIIENPCNGRGTCGKCKVRHISGKLPSAGEKEKELLSAAEQEENIRLSCCVFPREDATFEIRQNEEGDKVLSDGFTPEYVFEPSVYKKLCQIEKPSIENQKSYTELFAHATNIDSINLKTLRQLPVNQSVCTAIYHNDDLLFIESGDIGGEIYGLAIDIGTTTVVVSLINLLTGKILGSETCINAQKAYGSDVLTRITYVLEKPEIGIRELHDAVVGDINKLIKTLCEKNHIDHSFIYDIAVAANPTMLHLLLEINPVTIGVSPYVPVFSSALDVPAMEVGLLCADTSRLYCLPGVSAYIGSDVVAGAYVSGFAEEKGNVLFIDIGTNGEIALACGGKIISCSCAAGPAFEGMNISAGTRAVPGAIEDIVFEDDMFKITTIDNEEPVGICGSGVMAAISEMFAGGFLKTNGALYKEDDFVENDFHRNFLWTQGRDKGVYLYKGKTSVSITQKDIRQVQLAKAAILSGFYALLKIAGIGMEDLDKVIIAGQFGSHLSVKSLVGIGLIPAELSEKIVYIGNSAHTGAYLSLISKRSRKEMERLAVRISYKELSTLSEYERLFRKCLEFPNQRQ